MKPLKPLKPLKPKNIAQKALDVNGFNKEEIMKFPYPMEAKKDLERLIKNMLTLLRKIKELIISLYLLGKI